MTAAATGAAAFDPRIAAVENGLLSIPPLRDQPPERYRLLDRMAQFTVPGVSVAVIDDGEIAWARGYGVKASGQPDPVTPETLFLAGSISKPVTAAAVLRLVEQGRLNLDEDVNASLTSWQVPANDGWRPRLTLRHLLSHTGGLTVHGFPGYPRDQAPPTLVQILDGLPPANTPAIRVNAVPGTQMRYSGGGYCVIHQLLVDVTGTPFPQLLQELVLGPLGMAASTFENPLPEARWGEAATGHRAGGKPVYGRWHIYPEMAAAGLWTTAADLCRFALALQRALAGREGMLLSPSMARHMLSPQGEDHIGLGMFLNKKQGWFGHSGGDEGFVCNLTALRDRGQGAVVMTNSDRPATLIQELLRGIAAAYEWPDYLPKPRLPVAVDASAAAACAGIYELRPDFRLKVTWDQNRLALAPPGQSPMPLLPESDSKYFLTVVDAEITFVRDGRGQVTSLTLRQNGRDMVAHRVG